MWYNSTMISEGIKDHSTFTELHPAVTTIYFVLVIGITMFSNEPVFLSISFAAAALYHILLKGVREIRNIIIITVVVAGITTVINGFFTHNGETVLFYIGSNRITAEAFAFAAGMSLMLVAVIQWFVCFSIITTSDKMIYVFGAVLPVIGLMISIIFRSIPLLQKRFSDIDAAQKAMGHGEDKGFFRKARQKLKEISILIAWSLEASIDTADSMTARGYGLHGRTSFHLFKFEKRDALAIVIGAVCGAACIAGCVFGIGRIYYYPVVRPSNPDLDGGVKILFYVLFALLAAIPFFYELYGEYQWRKYESVN